MGRRDTREKHEAIERAWNARSKFLRQLRRSRLYRLRRAFRLTR